MSVHLPFNQLVTRAKTRAHFHAYADWLDSHKGADKRRSGLKILLDPALLPVWILLLITCLLYSQDVHAVEIPDAACSLVIVATESTSAQKAISFKAVNEYERRCID